MEFEVINIGDEVLYGYTENTNASFISKQLLESGFLPVGHIVVGDDPDTIEQTLTQALKRERVIITTGGLGPTIDDLTRKIVAGLFGVMLAPRDDLKERFNVRYGKDYPTLSDQTEQPEGALLLANELGSASGLILEDEKLFPRAILIALPGVPEEMKEMLTKQVIPFLKKRYTNAKGLIIKTMHFVGLREHELDPTLRKLKMQYPDVGFGIYPGISVVTIHLRAKSEEMLAPAYNFIRDHFGMHLFSSPSGTLLEAVHLELIRQKISLATAESCTGGAIAAAFVQNPNASAYLQAGVVAYSNDVKIRLLGVDAQVIDKRGAVCEEVTCQMAQNVKRLINTDLAIAVSGIMGPAGGSKEKPVGTVAASIAYKELPVFSWTMSLKGNREMLIKKTVQEILAQTLLFLRKLNR